MNAMFQWIECFGGPADGEEVPIDPQDPPPTLPYINVDQQVYYYELRCHADGRLRLFYASIVSTPGWEPVRVQD
jgi:hypothetical protein